MRKPVAVKSVAVSVAEPIDVVDVVEPEPAVEPAKESWIHKQLLADLRDHIRISPSAAEEMGDVLDLEWNDVDGGIEARRGAQLIRVTREEIVLSHTQFGSKKTIPIR